MIKSIDSNKRTRKKTNPAVTGFPRSYIRTKPFNEAEAEARTNTPIRKLINERNATSININKINIDNVLWFFKTKENTKIHNTISAEINVSFLKISCLIIL